MDEIEGEKKDLENRNFILEEQLDEVTKILKDKDNFASKTDASLIDRNYFESEMRRMKNVELNLNQELKQKHEDKIIFIDDYEKKIANLQNDIALIRMQREGDNSKNNHALNLLHDENVMLSNDITKLISIKKNLEEQLDKLTPSFGRSLNKLELHEVSNKNMGNVSDQEKQTIEVLKALLKSKNDEIVTMQEGNKLN